MKIAMFYELFWPSYGGIETWIASVSKELIKRGYDVDIITGGIPNQSNHEVIDGLNIIRIDYHDIMAKLFIQGFSALKRQIIWSTIVGRRFWKYYKNDYDIIHAHVQSSMIAALLGAGPKKLVWSWHGTYHGLYWDMYPFHWALFYETMEHLSSRLPFAACITADEYTKKLAVNHMHANPSKFFPVANGVDVDMFKPMKVSKPKNWDGNFHIVTTRRLVPKTGIQFLIPAIEPIIKEIPDTHLMIYGGGPMSDTLVSLTKKLKIEKNVHFMGPAPHSEMPKIYNAADVVAIPSLIEATSLSCLEAMSCGKTIVTCPVGGVPEIAPKNTVIYTTPGNIKSLEKGLRKAIIEMSSSDRKKLGNKAFKHVSNNFTWKHTVNKILKIYEKVLS